MRLEFLRSDEVKEDCIRRIVHGMVFHSVQELRKEEGKSSMLISSEEDSILKDGFWLL